MKDPIETIRSEDPFNLTRFISAQEGVYERALSELIRGRKQSHWMWFFFPQLAGLGKSETSEKFAIKSVEEAYEYLAHPVLGERLFEFVELVLDIEGRSVTQIFGFPDDVKLRSSMTLFEYISKPNSVFADVLDKFFNGHRDPKTLQLLEVMKENQGKRKS
jgi:uncharacterized protein (DUF1810 family)